jgi:hypothetical protein
MGRLILAGTCIASALLLAAAGATAAQASTAPHATPRHSFVRHTAVRHAASRDTAIRHAASRDTATRDTTVRDTAVRHAAERHGATRHHRFRRWHRSTAPSQCEIWARTHAFEYLKTAQRAADGAATLIAERATVVCGGPDDWHFVYGTATVTSFVLGNAIIQVLASTGAGIVFKTIPTTRLVKYLPHDEWTRTFQVTGPLDAITALEEIYHP